MNSEYRNKNVFVDVYLERWTKGQLQRCFYKTVVLEEGTTMKAAKRIINAAYPELLLFKTTFINRRTKEQ